MNLEIAAPILAMVAVVLAILAIDEMLTGARRRWLAQSRKHNNALADGSTEVEGLTIQVERKGTRFPLLERLISGDRTGEKTRQMLQGAGLRLRVGEYQAIRITTAMVFLCVGLATTKEVVVGIVALIMGYIVPGVVVGTMRGRRMSVFNNQLVPCMEMISTGLASGFSFLQGMEAVRQELTPPITEEIGRVLHEVSLGNSTEEALMAMVKRTGDQDLKLAITAVLIQRRVGGNLAEVLNNISGTLRERMRIRGEVLTLTAQARGSAIIVGLLPIAMAGLIFVINREYMSLLFTETLGRYLLAVAAVMEFIGFMVMKNMVKIEV